MSADVRMRTMIGGGGGYSTTASTEEIAINQQRKNITVQKIGLPTKKEDDISQESG